MVHMTGKVDKESGRLIDVPYVASANCDDRPADIEIDVIVIHAISLPPGCYGGWNIEHFFTNRLVLSKHPYFEQIHQLRVSAHFLINRLGKIIQFVPTHKRAWHAGVSSFDNRTRVNDFSIGIELEGCDEDPFEDEQYDSLKRLTHCLMRTYPTISRDNIVGHCDIAPQRKTDPGPKFNWQRYRSLIETL